MYFLIEFCRPTGRLLTFRRFPEAQLKEAQDARLALELYLFRRHIEHEVTILEADSVAALRLTHGRYFWRYFKP